MLKPSSTRSGGEQRQLTLVGVVHGDEHVAAGRQAAVVGGELALGEGVREVTVEAHDLTGGTHLRSEQHVDGLAQRGAEALERQHGFLDGHLLATVDVTTVAREAAAGRCHAAAAMVSPAMMRAAALARATPVALEANGTVREARGLASMTYSVLAMKAYCTLIRPWTPQPLAMA